MRTRLQIRMMIAAILTCLVVQVPFPSLGYGQGGLESCTVRVDQVGDTFQEGVGFGGVRLGAPEADITARWGGTACHRADLGDQYQYLLRDRNDAGVLLLSVLTTSGVISHIGVILIPHAPTLGPPVRTTAGIAMGSSAADVRRIYGPPEEQSRQELVYVSRGVAFELAQETVFGWFVFRPGSWPPR